MHLLSINIGAARELRGKDEAFTTGIFKHPTAGPVRIGALGLEGDVIVNKRHHGGPDQAVYVYGGGDYAWWAETLGEAIPPGTFGENLTISELETAAFDVGDYLHVGAVTLQATAPRVPCGVFAARMGDAWWVKKFRRAERYGLYCRVIREGEVQTGDPVEIEKFSGPTLSILEMARLYYERDHSEEALRRQLEAPIDMRSRAHLEGKLRFLTGD